ncbi:oligopeptide/dipeptide ABC transporter ATP-binding protein [Palleronia sp. LCG004]|uniref:ABC transporter ATP-binding protein n=1 Tax=Palleronia sp. LCG004 TaxID=3079304 RepID=UPI00294292C3|nr:oligopeptide/dipeptide ABC transporter ATP-binding protein [Palleronia sp. LCG004]WOI58313.1 ATP-binding cassette domain-containing protein [Palleronia sp. LCG004]
MNDTLLQIDDLKVHFAVPGGTVRAVDGVSFDIRRGEVLGVVGESGSGKSTVGRGILRLETPTDGSIRFDGTHIHNLPETQFRAYRRRMQYVFQDPYASLNPRKRVDALIGEALSIHSIGSRSSRPGRIAELLEQVGLPKSAMSRYPHEFSGGQRQRIGIARALAVEPEFIIADEPVSALDVSVQAQVVNLLQDLQRDLGLTMLFIAHDLSVVEHLCDRVVVLYLGKVMEIGTRSQIYGNPRHPYTRALLAAAPKVGKRPQDTPIVEGDIPSPMAPPSGCVFRTRCPLATDACASAVPPLERLGEGHKAACIHLDRTAES